MNLKKLAIIFVLVVLSSAALRAQQPEGRWSEAQASAWYAQQPWLVGSNYIPTNAINQFEMWQTATFDPAQIDKELSWAEAIGMNTMRVFLQDQLWTEDAPGFSKRLDTFLALAQKHHIKPLFVLFDSCWEENPTLGPQHPPIPGVHNSGWVQSPGTKELLDPATYPLLKQYVQGVVGKFAKDDRILGWDVWNEPQDAGAAQKAAQPVEKLLPQVFEWARAVHPTQPVTSGVFRQVDWTDSSRSSEIARIQVEQSDIISFHNYKWPEEFAVAVEYLHRYHRPLLCTEYMARGVGSTFDTVLPIGKKENVGMFNWGFVNGKTQTNLPWDSWERPYVGVKNPPVWFHDVFWPDGHPYRQAEINLIHELTGRGNMQLPKPQQSHP